MSPCPKSQNYHLHREAGDCAPDGKLSSEVGKCQPGAAVAGRLARAENCAAAIVGLGQVYLPLGELIDVQRKWPACKKEQKELGGGDCPLQWKAAESGISGQSPS